MHGSDSSHETGSFRGYKTKSALTYSMSDSFERSAARFGTAAVGRARLFRAAKKSFFQVSFFAARSPRPLMSAPGFIAIHYSWGRGLAGGSGGRPGGGGAKGCARPTEAKSLNLSAGDPERGSCAGGGHCGPGYGEGNVSADFEPLKGWEALFSDSVSVHICSIQTSAILSTELCTFL